MAPVITPRSVARLEDLRFLSGRGRFTSDLNREGQLHAVVVRSDRPHAELLAIDSRDAESLPGVVAVHTAADLTEDGLGPLPCVTDIGAESSLVVPERHALAVSLVRHVGDPIALVLAESAAIARAAADQVVVEYRTLPAVVDATKALEMVEW